jgi:gag-polypeptide of LTR copia-type
MPYPFKGEVLVGRTNYIEWKPKAELFLEINGYMPFVNGVKTKPDKALYYKSDNTPYSPELAVKYIEKLADYEDNEAKALGALKSIISIDNIERFKAYLTAKELYNAIKTIFGESSFELIGRYIDKINNIEYTACKNMDEYTSIIQSAYQYLLELKEAPTKANIAWNIFKGLPSSFDAFSSRKYEELGRDLKNIDINKLVSELIAEEARMKAYLNEDKANSIAKNSRNNRKTTKFCKFCKKSGHIEESCFKKYPELAPKRASNSDNKHFIKKEQKASKSDESKGSRSTLLYSNESINKKTSFIIDSGASEHYTPYKDWLDDYIEFKKPIYIANNQSIQALGYGNIHLILYNKDKEHSVTISKA